MARDLQIHVRVVLQDLEGAVENGYEPGRISAEPVLKLMPSITPVNFLTSGRNLVRAAVLVLVAVEGLGLVRALVVRVGDAVAVVVGIGAAVVVLEAVLVLGLVGALVERVGDAVLVVVEIGAAVVVLEAVLVLGLVGALVERVGDAVAVVVGIGAAVVVLEAVLVLGLVGALVDVVGDAVAVLVGPGLGPRSMTLSFRVDVDLSTSPKLMYRPPKTSKSGPV